MKAYKRHPCKDMKLFDSTTSLCLYFYAHSTTHINALCGPLVSFRRHRQKCQDVLHVTVQLFLSLPVVDLMVEVTVEAIGGIHSSSWE